MANKKFINLSIFFFVAIFALIFFAHGASAATYYVNASAGDDSRTTAQAQNSATPWLTLQHAETAAANGDTVYASAGTYVENSGLNQGWWVTKDIGWIAQGEVIVRGTGACSVVLQVYGTVGTTLNGFTIDAEGTRAYAASFSTSSANNTLENMTFQGATTATITNFRGVNNSITNSTFTVGTGVTGVNITPNSGDVLTLSGNTINISNGSYLFRTISGGGTVNITSNIITGYSSNPLINVNQSGTYNITDNTISINGTTPDVFSTTSGTGMITFEGNNISIVTKTSNPAIYFAGGTWTVDINDNAITDTDVTQTQSIISVKNQFSPIIQNNVIETHSSTMNSDISITSTGTSGGTLQIKDNILRSRGSSFIITVGTDSPDAGSTKLNGGIIENNTIYGALYYNPLDTTNQVHAIYYSQNVNAVIRKNTIIGVGMGVVIKGTGQSFSSGGIYYNKIINANAVASIRIKGVKNVPVYNNSVWSNSTLTSRLVYITEYNVGETATGTILKNNILYGANSNSVEINDGSQTDFSSNYNNFYRDAGSNIGVIAATTYSDLNLWQAAGFDTNGISADPIFEDSDNYNLNLLYNSPSIDGGISISGLSTDILGNSFYGTPDIGAYEYQPPYDMGTDEVDITANVRVYGDGKFRNAETPGGTTADLSVIPQGSQTTKWLDITKADDEASLIWETSHKKWKESSTTLGATNTLHTVGDLTAGKSYTLKIDDTLATANINGSDCASGICTANEFGKITFTYTGGYSNHTFDIDDDIASIITITSPETGATVSGDDTITFTDSEQTDPECSVDNSTWVNCANTITSFSTLTGWSGISESGTFTLYMRDTDASGNIGTASVTNLVKADTQAPVRSGGSPSGEMASDTTSATLSLTTSESATCKYSTTSGTVYASMTESLTTSNGTAHSANISGLSSGNSYNYYVRCQDQSENANDTDYLISFSVAAQSNDENTDEDNDDEKELNVHKVKAESTENTITITWKTDHNTKSSVRYGTDKNLKQKKKDKEKEKKHKMVLKDLLPDTKYYFRIKAEDSDDNEDSSRIHSIKTLPEKMAIQATSTPQNENQTQNQTEAETNTNPNVCSYTIESGDSLWSIAKKVYGDATAFPQIIEKNKDKYSDIESKLSIGQELTFDCKNDTDLNTDTNTPSQQVQETETQAQEPQETSNFKWYNPFSWF